MSKREIGLMNKIVEDYKKNIGGFEEEKKKKIKLC